MTPIFFDLDMTLVETRVDIARSANEVRVRFGLEPLPQRQVEGYIGSGVDILLSRTLGDRWVGRETEAVAAFRAHYNDHALDHAHVNPGIESLLAELADHPLAVVSNKPEAACGLVLEGMNLRDHFDVVVGGDTAGALKPDPAPVRAAARQLGVEVDGAIMIGDSTVDVLAARAAGCRSIAVATGLDEAAELRRVGPDRLVGRSEEIRVALRELL